MATIGKQKAADGAHWTGTESKQRDQLLKQFCKTQEGSTGNSKAYVDGWLRIFGKKPDLVFVFKQGEINVCELCGMNFASSQIALHIHNDHF